MHGRRHLARYRTLALGSGVLLGLAACSSGPKPPTMLALTIHGGAGQNPDASGGATPVAVVLYPLAATGKFGTVDPYSLISGARGALGADLAGPTERRIVAPGSTTSVRTKLPTNAQALGIAVMFRAISKAKWRYVVPLEPHKVNTMTLTISGLGAKLAVGKGG